MTTPAWIRRRCAGACAWRAACPAAPAAPARRAPPAAAILHLRGPGRQLQDRRLLPRLRRLRGLRRSGPALLRGRLLRGRVLRHHGSAAQGVPRPGPALLAGQGVAPAAPAARPAGPRGSRAARAAAAVTGSAARAAKRCRAAWRSPAVARAAEQRQAILLPGRRLRGRSALRRRPVPGVRRRGPALLQRPHLRGRAGLRGRSEGAGQRGNPRPLQHPDLWGRGPAVLRGQHLRQPRQHLQGRPVHPLRPPHPALLRPQRVPRRRLLRERRLLPGGRRQVFRAGRGRVRERLLRQMRRARPTLL